MIRIFDIIVSVILIVLTLPLMLIGFLGIKLTSPGPAIYRASRSGQFGHKFTMYKLRTMHVASGNASAITGPNDTRIFPFGNLLRRTKIDELPQFWNVLFGDISIVGPRPEDPGIVDKYYTEWMMDTLEVRPGITSPGALFGYCFGDLYLDPEQPESSYGELQLPPKLAIERAYIERMSLGSNLGVILATARTIGELVLTSKKPALPFDSIAARKWCGDEAFVRAESTVHRN